MRTQDFPFADAISFSVRISEQKFKIKPNQLLDYTFIDDLFYLFADDPFRGETEAKKTKSQAVIAEILGAESAVRERIIAAKDRNILRVDHFDTKSNVIQLSMLEYKSKSLMAEKLQIIIDDVITPRLHQLNIDPKEATKIFERDILFQMPDIGRTICFSIGLDRLILLGTRWRLTIEQTGASGYLHVTNVDPRPRGSTTSDGQIQLILSPGIQFNNKADIQKELSAQSKAIYQQMVAKDNGELLKLWDVYNQCELECAKTESEKAGFLQYDQWHQEGRRVIFSLSKEVTIPDAFLNTSEAFSAVGRDDNPYKSGAPIPVIGEASDENELGNSQFVLIIDETFNPLLVPKSGKLFLSYRGTEAQTKRRKDARENISFGRCGLPDLRLLLQSGSIIGETRKHRAPITRGLEKYIFKGQNGLSFNESQKKAIDAAINTPDVAVIQGPPGTGKTQVIRAVIERIREEEKGEARILVTSTQHDAVDNAIRGIVYNGVPANRAVDRRHEDTVSSPIYGWIDDVSLKCEGWLEKQIGVDNSNVLSQIRALADIDPQSEEFNEYLAAIGHILDVEKYPSTLRLQLQEIENDIHDSGKGDPNTEELKRRISNLPLTCDEFLNEGKDSLKQLSMFIRYELDHPEWVPSEWRELIRATEKTDKLQEKLNQLDNQLKKILELAGADAPPMDLQLIRLKLDELSSAIAKEQIKREEAASAQTKICSLVQEFRHELSNAVNVNALIRSYSQLNAATNQQSVNKRILEGSNGFSDRYDYVIVDEAARSNPLDLMIPMSLGHRVILVGDQKQLPPMLEPDVTSRVISNHKEHPEYATLLHESLFLRLFNRMNEEDNKAGAKTRRVVMLDTQFRMHPMISNIVSKLFYDGKLKSGCTAEQKAYDMHGLYNNSPLVWLDMPESAYFPGETPGKSKFRKCEVNQVSHELQQIIYRDNSSSIGIITFYRKQMLEIKKLVDVRFQDQKHRIEIGTVDSFQGKEFDFVILSTVRSNDKQELRDKIGFLDDDNRMCVAFSRARKLLMIIGDSKTVSAARPFNEMLKACREGGGYYENLGT